MKSATPHPVFGHLLPKGVIAHRLSCGTETEAVHRCWQILTGLAATCDCWSTDFVDLLTSHIPIARQLD